MTCSCQWGCYIDFLLRLKSSFQQPRGSLHPVSSIQPGRLSRLPEVRWERLGSKGTSSSLTRNSRESGEWQWSWMCNTWKHEKPMGLPIHKIILIVCSPTNSGWPLYTWMLTTSGSMLNASRFNYDMSPAWNPLNGEITPSEYERAFRITVDKMDKVISAWPETCSLLGLLMLHV